MEWEDRGPAVGREEWQNLGTFSGASQKTNAGTELACDIEIEQRLRNMDQGQWMWLKEGGRRISMDLRGCRVLSEANRKLPKCGRAPWMGQGMKNKGGMSPACSERHLRRSCIWVVEGLFCSTWVPRCLCLLSWLGTSRSPWTLIRNSTPFCDRTKRTWFPKGRNQRKWGQYWLHVANNTCTTGSNSVCYLVSDSSITFLPTSDPTPLTST